MNFKPGDKVWIENRFPTDFPLGTYPGVLVTPTLAHPAFGGWWEVEIDGLHGELPDGHVVCHETIIRRRDDPPPQQEPKREATGDWDLCPWRPAHAPTEVV